MCYTCWKWGIGELYCSLLSQHNHSMVSQDVPKFPQAFAWALIKCSTSFLLCKYLSDSTLIISTIQYITNPWNTTHRYLNTAPPFLQCSFKFIKAMDKWLENACTDFESYWARIEKLLSVHTQRVLKWHWLFPWNTWLWTGCSDTSPPMHEITVNLPLDRKSVV